MLQGSPASEVGWIWLGSLLSSHRLKSRYQPSWALLPHQFGGRTLFLVGLRPPFPCWGSADLLCPLTPIPSPEWSSCVYRPDFPFCRAHEVQRAHPHLCIVGCAPCLQIPSRHQAECLPGSQDGIPADLRACLGTSPGQPERVSETAARVLW